MAPSRRACHHDRSALRARRPCHRRHRAGLHPDRRLVLAAPALRPGLARHRRGRGGVRPVRAGARTHPACLSAAAQSGDRAMAARAGAVRHLRHADGGPVRGKRALARPALPHTPARRCGHAGRLCPRPCGHRGLAGGRGIAGADGDVRHRRQPRRSRRTPGRQRRRGDDGNDPRPARAARRGWPRARWPSASPRCWCSSR